MSRRIISEDEEYQVQQDENGVSYFYRKDYIAKGDMKEEYSLSLMWSQKIRNALTDCAELATEESERRGRVEEGLPPDSLGGPGAAAVCEGAEPALPAD
jgi:hypothetical protein